MFRVIRLACSSLPGIGKKRIREKRVKPLVHNNPYYDKNESDTEPYSNPSIYTVYIIVICTHRLSYISGLENINSIFGINIQTGLLSSTTQTARS